jgi:ABC-type multidrug transport system permease subunit
LYFLPFFLAGFIGVIGTKNGLVQAIIGVVAGSVLAFLLGWLVLFGYMDYTDLGIGLAGGLGGAFYANSQKGKAAAGIH